MITLIAVLGAPATGKTALMQRIVQENMNRSSMLPCNAGRAVGEIYPSTRTIVLGKYVPVDNCPGTDRLPTQPTPDDYLEYLVRLNQSPQYNHTTVFFESSHLLAQTDFLEAVQRSGILFEVYLLQAPVPVLQERRKNRLNNQDSSSANLAAELRRIQDRFSCHELQNATPRHQQSLLQELLTKAGITLLTPAKRRPH